MAPVNFAGVGVEPSQGRLTIPNCPAYERKWIPLGAGGRLNTTTLEARS